MPRGSKRRFTPEQDTEIARLYEAGRTTYEIAEVFGVSPHPVADSLQRQGVPLRTGGRQPNWTGSQAQRDEVLAAYRSGESIRKIAERLHIRAQAVIETLDTAGEERWGAGSRRRFDDETAQQIASAYLTGAAMTDLARQYGTNATTIGNYLARQGVTLREPGAPLFWTEDRKAEARRRYECGESQQKIADALGCSQAGVSYALAKQGISIRGPVRKGPAHRSWKGGRRINDGGYVEVKLPDDDPLVSMRNSTGYVPEHRLVMARKLGRPLLPGERPHHKNLIRSDNTPSNLELWLTSQPSGGRAADLIEWALTLLDRYMPEVLVADWRDRPYPEKIT